MIIKSPTLPRNFESTPLRQVTISLSPHISYRKKNLPTLRFSESKSPQKSTRVIPTYNDKYTISYIGDTSGSLSISSRTLKIPRLSHIQISKETRLFPSPSIQISKNNTIHNYFRAKPLTPASKRLYKFTSQQNPKINKKKQEKTGDFFKIE